MKSDKLPQVMLLEVISVEAVKLERSAVTRPHHYSLRLAAPGDTPDSQEKAVKLTLN